MLGMLGMLAKAEWLLRVLTEMWEKLQVMAMSEQ